MECGLDHPPLPEMKPSFAGQQAFTQKRFRALESTALHELVCIYDENVADEIGIIKKICMLWAKAEISYIAEFGKR